MREGVVLWDRPLIEWIDFLMPQKTHRENVPRSGLLVLRQQPAFELGRRPIAERGGQAFLVVDLVEKDADAGAGLGQVAIFRPVNFLILQGLDKRFAGRIVPRIPWARHADPDAVVVKAIECNRGWRIAHRDRNDAPAPLTAEAVPEPCAGPARSARPPGCAPGPSRSPAGKMHPASLPGRQTPAPGGCM